MGNEIFLLAQLLDEPSFIAWLKGNGSAADNLRWEKWLVESPFKKDVVARAKKLLAMPFAEVNVDSEDILNELERLKKDSTKLRLKK